MGLFRGSVRAGLYTSVDYGMMMVVVMVFAGFNFKALSNTPLATFQSLPCNRMK